LKISVLSNDVMGKKVNTRSSNSLSVSPAKVTKFRRYTIQS